MKSYKEILKAHRDKELSQAVAYLSTSHLSDLIRDILLGQTSILEEDFLESSSLHSSDEIAFNWMLSLPPQQLRVAADVFDRVFQETLEGKHANDEEIQNRIKAFTACNKFGLSQSFIRSLLREPGMKDKELGLDLLLLLSKLEDTVDAGYWYREIDLKKTPQLAPAFISAFKKSNPQRALGVLLDLQEIDYQPAPEGQRYYRLGIRSAAYHLLKDCRPEPLRWFTRFRQHLQESWSRNLIDQMLKHPKFKTIEAELRIVSEATEEPNSEDAFFAKELAGTLYATLLENTEQSEQIAKQAAQKISLWQGIVQRIITELFLDGIQKEKLGHFRDFFRVLDDQLRPALNEFLTKNYNLYYDYSNEVLESLAEEDLIFCFFSPEQQELPKQGLQAASDIQKELDQIIFN